MPTLEGMDQTASQELDSIKQAILDTLNVTEIYLFGSFAYGAQSDSSDFDIYVVIPNDSMRKL